jgi:hypothetical protein
MMARTHLLRLGAPGVKRGVGHRHQRGDRARGRCDPRDGSGGSRSRLVVILGFTALSSVAIQGIEDNDTPWAGALERVSAYGFMVWVAVLA